MKNLFNKKALSTVLVCFSLTACSSNNNDGDMTGEGAASDFAFSTAVAADYARIDRSGMPAVSTALIASKDSYNESNPTDDSNGVFVPEIIASLEFLHGALDGQLQGLGLTPCTVIGDGSGSCVTAAAPLLVPDTLKIDTAAGAGFPNGRLLTDPVMDVTLAVALLELTGDPAPHSVDALVGVLNPTANDLEFSAQFPFLADPH